LTLLPENDPDVLLAGFKDEATVAKLRALDDITVNIDGVDYDANNDGQLNLSAVGVVANWMFTKKMLESLTAMLPIASPELKGFIQIQLAVYQGVYHDLKVGWKATDNTIHQLSAEQVLAGLYESMQKKAQVLHETSEEVSEAKVDEVLGRA